jgi:hypothetical protein
MKTIEWATGLFEGEGSITHDNGRPQISLEMTDKDVVEAFAEVVGVGKVNGPYRRSNKPDYYKPTYKWKIKAKADVRKVLSMMLPNLGTRRAHRALDALDYIELY